jgi:hypothetical protein
MLFQIQESPNLSREDYQIANREFTIHYPVSALIEIREVMANNGKASLRYSTS